MAERKLPRIVSQLIKRQEAKIQRMTRDLAVANVRIMDFIDTVAAQDKQIHALIESVGTASRGLLGPVLAPSEGQTHPNMAQWAGQLDAEADDGDDTVEGDEKAAHAMTVDGLLSRINEVHNDGWVPPDSGDPFNPPPSPTDATLIPAAESQE